jgi:hypothetical protein
MRRSKGASALFAALLLLLGQCAPALRWHFPAPVSLHMPSCVRKDRVGVLTTLAALCTGLLQCTTGEDRSAGRVAHGSSASSTVSKLFNLRECAFNTQLPDLVVPEGSVGIGPAESRLWARACAELI